MINQPTNEIPLPADIQKAYDNARNAVTLAEAEVIRLRDLRITEEATIIELNKQIAWGKEQLSALEVQLEDRQKNLVTLVDTSTSLGAEIDILREEKKTLSESLTERESACIAKEKQLAEYEYSLNARSSDLNTRVESVKKREDEVTEREDKLKNFTSTL